MAPAAAKQPAKTGDKKDVKKLTPLQRKIKMMKQRYSLVPKNKQRKKGGYPKVKLRKSLTPGTVVILVAGRQQHKGSRVVFLKQLDSGHILVAGPTGLNKMPLMPVLQNFVIATSTKIPLSDEVKAQAEKVSFAQFKKAPKKKTKDSGIFSDSTAEETVVVAKVDPEVEKAIDEGLMACLPAFSKDTLDVTILKKYMKSKFTVRNGQYPHNMKF